MELYFEETMNQTDNQVHGLWIGKTLSVIELLTIRSFQKHGYVFNLWIYEPLETKLSNLVVIRDANEILPQSSVFFYEHKSQFGIGKGSVAGFSDIFRYKLLYDFGGWWVDMDVTCLQPFYTENPYFFRNHHDLLLVGNVMKTPKHAPVMKACFETAMRSVDATNQDWHKPIQILVDNVLKFQLEGAIHSGVSNSDQWDKIRPFLLEEIEIDPNWKFIHWCNEAWRHDFLNKQEIIYNSTLGKLLLEYELIPRLTDSEMRLHDSKIRRNAQRKRWITRLKQKFSFLK